MEKPINGKCPCRTQSWYIVLISFLIWFSLFYLYSSSITFGKMGDSFLGNNRTGFVGSSESSLHDVVKNETGNASYVNDVKIEDNKGKAIDETENDRKPIKFYIDRDIDIDRLIALLMADDNETETFETISGKILEEEFRNVRDDLPTIKGRREAKSSKRRGRIKPVEAVAAATTIPKKVEQVVPQPRTQNMVKPQEPKPQNVVKPEPDPSPCLGRYIFVHDIPRKFNQDLLDNCQSLSSWTDMCESALNLGLGPPLPFLLEVIFHNSMKQYQCLTNDPMVASAIYVPYYAGLDVGRYLWGPIGYRRDHDAMELVKWLAGRPEWKNTWGRDHFLVAGRINWDFRRDLKNVSDWGNGLLTYPESKNMTMLVIESSPWNNIDFAIPYPTYFHPSRDDDVFQWQNRMRELKRRFLFSFGGARRPNRDECIRNEIIDQCLVSRKRCRFLECDQTQRCYKPENLMKLFQSSIFCLQPPGNSYTRRSIFDSILAGCVPVFFHPGSAYVQYLWHFPKDYTKYSVLIPASAVKSGEVNIEQLDEVIKLIPNVIYADPASRLQTIGDAFNLTVKGVLDRVETIRNQMKDGKEVNSEFPEQESWKYLTFGKLGGHEWDPFFSSKLGKLSDGN
ncbi:hypothetical protein ES288_D07G116400v1 [Gossypium darwinii]|uniref:Exostosin GT47 domain-containing protein n=1 Tax=Gossypium darwinii TaxID=34276 RepID=A0A5D2BUP1_GOSDA|nr:hypothetical protein ES288_D07G116400v1 [Gossypium darwinii]